MKQYIIALFISLTLISFTSCKDKKGDDRADEKNVITENDVPPAIQTAFTTKYPGASEIIWEDAKEDDIPTIKVKFKKDGKYWKAEFKADGSLVKEGEDN